MTYKNGATEPNVVLGASMGGLVARYALRDMELNSIIHDTRLFCSLDSPHQGANIPVGLQAMVSHLYGQKTNFPGIENKTIGSLNKELKRNYRALNSPAARQMMLYSIVGSGSSINLDNTIHTEFMNEYSSMGYPNGQHHGDKFLDVRNLVIANGSECGTNQGFAPGALLGSSVGFPTDELDDWMVSFAQILAPTQGNNPLIGSVLAGLSHVRQEISIWALPNQTGASVYFGKWRIFKKMPWFIPDISVQLFSRIYNAHTSLLPVDNAAGGTREFPQGVSPINWLIPRFGYVLTFSALDIGGGLQPITSASLTTSFSPSSPPVTPNNVFAHNFVAAPPPTGALAIGRANEPHVLITIRNGRWFFQEITGTSAFFSCAYACNITPTISGPSVVQLSGSVFSSNITNATLYTWTVPAGWKINGQAVTSLTLTTSSGASVTIQPPLTSCGSLANLICVKVGDCEIPACVTRAVVACTNDALKFDGANDFVNIPEKNGRMNLGTGNFVMEAFIKSTVSGSVRSLLSKRTFVSGSTSDGFFFGIFDDGRPFLQLKGAPNILPPVGSANLYDGSCHHVAVRRSGTTLSFFVDGNFIGNGDATSSRDISSTGAIRVAGDLITTSAYNGWIGEVRIWNTALTNAQILSNVPISIPIQTTLRAYYDMKDLAGSQVLTDLSTTVTTTKNNGTLGSVTGTDTADPIWLNQNQITCSVQGNFRMGPLPVDNSFLADSLKSKTEKTLSIVSGQKGGEEGLLHVYPNPFDNELIIMHHTNDGNYRLRVLNSTGIELVNEANQISGKEYSVGGDWTSGLYILIIEDRQRRFLKIIKK